MSAAHFVHSECVTYRCTACYRPLDDAESSVAYEDGSVCVSCDDAIMSDALGLGENCLEQSPEVGVFPHDA